MWEAPVAYRSGPGQTASSDSGRPSADRADGPVDARALAQLAASVGHGLQAGPLAASLSGTNQADTTDRAAAIVRAAELQGLHLEVKLGSRGEIAHLTPPFLILNSNPDAVLLVEAQQGSTLIATRLQANGSSESTAVTLGKLDLRQAAIIKPLDQPGHDGPRRTRDLILNRLRPILAQIAVASVVINLLALATPLFMMTVYNKVLGHGALHTLDVLAIGMLTLFAFDGGLRLLRNRIISHAGARIDATLGAELIERLLQKPWRDLQAMTSGQVVEQLRQLDNVRLFFSGQVPILWIDLVFVLLFLGVLVALSPALALVTLGAIPLLVGFSWWTGQRQRERVARGFEAASARASVVGETVANALTVKALGLETEVARKFDRTLAASAETAFAAAQLQGLNQTGGLLVQHLVALALVYVGAHQIIAGQLSVGALIACTILATRALAPLRQLAGAWQQILAVRDAMAMLDRAITPTASAGAPIAWTFGGEVRLERVTYRYAEHGPPAIADVDLLLQPGRTVALLGAPGSGKSTLAKVVAGVLEPNAGRVLVDGFDAGHLDASLRRSGIGYVPQEVQLFRTTVFANIAAGVPDCEPGRVVAAAKFAGIHDVIESLPQGYETPIATGTADLSAGQRQLLTLARALVRNPRLLILDEATSALDRATETRLAENLARAVRGRALLLVTHRPLLLGLAHEAVWLDAGKVRLRGEPRAVLEAMRANEPPEEKA